jgi:hypothetical protein
MGHSIWYTPQWCSIEGKLHIVKNIQPTDYGPYEWNMVQVMILPSDKVCWLYCNWQEGAENIHKGTVKHYTLSLTFCLHLYSKS